jgi:hypothetical protein
MTARHERDRIALRFGNPSGRDLSLSPDEDKRELARDVSSFANAAGGDRVFGIEEAKDSGGKNLGYPAKLVGVECPNFVFCSLLRTNGFEGPITIFVVEDQAPLPPATQPSGDLP